MSPPITSRGDPFGQGDKYRGKKGDIYRGHLQS